jgi:alanyl-tRNA synthetase
MEFFSRGLELANQVYMWFDMSSAKDISQIKPLKLKVLDMGMGQERCAWFSQGTLNQYEATMPGACKYIFEKTKLKPNWDLYKKFLPYSGMLNLDEAEDVEKVWEDIAKKIGVDVDTLKSEIEPLAGVYSVADHARSLLYALIDGALPSNVKGGYNLRLVLRRALDFIYKYKWEIDLYEIMKIHADELVGLYPELKVGLEDKNSKIKEIIELEVEKYEKHKEKIDSKIKSIVVKNKELTTDDFIKYYISDGITPEEIRDSFKKQEIEIEIPNNFFTLVNEYFEERKKEMAQSEKSMLAEHVEDLPATELLFYEDVEKEEADVKVLKEFDLDNFHYVVLDKTLFYPTMGGQASDFGFIDGRKVVEAIKVGSVVVHKVE